MSPVFLPCWPLQDDVSPLESLRGYHACAGGLRGQCRWWKVLVGLNQAWGRPLTSVHLPPPQKTPRHLSLVQLYTQVGAGLRWASGVLHPAWEGDGL